MPGLQLMLDEYLLKAWVWPCERYLYLGKGSVRDVGGKPGRTESCSEREARPEWVPFFPEVWLGRATERGQVEGDGVFLSALIPGPSQALLSPKDK